MVISTIATTRICANPKCRRVGILLPLSDFNKNRKTCRECDRKRARKHRRKEWAKRRRIINKYLGKKCVICGEKKVRLLRCHEIYGKPHPRLLDTPLSVVEANCKSGRFARVCARGHGKAHALMDKWSFPWDLIQLYVKGFMRTHPPFGNDAHLRAWHRYMDNRGAVVQLRLPMEIEEEPVKKPVKKPVKPFVWREMPQVVINWLEDDEETGQNLGKKHALIGNIL